MVLLRAAARKQNTVEGTLVIDDQQDATFGLFICTQSALHFSGDIFPHHQEHLTVFAASDIVHLCCCQPMSRTRWNS
jgi:hypothetical protein